MEAVVATTLFNALVPIWEELRTSGMGPEVRLGMGPVANVLVVVVLVQFWGMVTFVGLRVGE